jgi:hypothetical protein
MTFADVPPSWAQKFQRDIVTALSALSKDVSDLKCAVTDLKIDVKRMQDTIRLVYCRPGMSVNLIGDVDDCASLLVCSKLTETSMMSVSELQADFVVNNRDEGLVCEFGGDCQFAARAACTFFETSRSLMRPRFEECVMYSPSGASIYMGVSSFAGESPPVHGVICKGMKAHSLDKGGCVWIEDSKYDMGRAEPALTGRKHYVVSVITLEGIRVGVDWGIHQFAELPSDVRLFFAE